MPSPSKAAKEEKDALETPAGEPKNSTSKRKAAAPASSEESPRKAQKPAKKKEESDNDDGVPEDIEEGAASSSKAAASVKGKGKPKAPKKAKEPAPAAAEGEGDDDKYPRNTTMPSSYTIPATPDSHVKIVSWNVSSLKAAAKKGLTEYVEAEDADIWLLQETKLQDAQGIPLLSKSKFPHQIWLSSEEKKGYSGSAVLSKIKPLSTQNGIGVAEHDKEGRTVTVEFERFYVVACYIPNAGQKLERLDYKKTYMAAMETYLKKLQAKKPVIWAGDLNVAHQEIDLARPKENKNKTAGFTDQERSDFSRILESVDLVDAFRHFKKEEREYTYFSYRFQCRAKHLGWRLDYFCVSRSLIDDGIVTGCEIRSEAYGASDHVPIVLLAKK